VLGKKLGPIVLDGTGELLLGEILRVAQVRAAKVHAAQLRADQVRAVQAGTNGECFEQLIVLTDKATLVTASTSG
jgi:hypothetical protein